MVAKILPAENLPAWLDKLLNIGKVYAPYDVEGSTTFKPVDSGSIPALDIIATDVPPKRLIFQQVEQILSYEMGENSLVIKQGDTDLPKKVIFGIRPCDAKAFEIIDTVFLDPAAPKYSYAARREATALVTLACNKAGRTCFCTSVDSSPGYKSGDVWMIDIGGRYYVETLTPYGEELIATGEGLFNDAGAEDEALAKQIIEKVEAGMEKLTVPAAKKLNDLFNDDAFWMIMADKCLSCGACTFLCPTCHCFDVQDEGSTISGVRYRIWDSCLFSRFTRAAGGHNPRVEHYKRLRQRMMHKFYYFIENSNVIGCVGCGRCIKSCPVAFDIREFLHEAIAATDGAGLSFVDELLSEDEKIRTCEVKPNPDIGVTSDDR